MYGTVMTGRLRGSVDDLLQLMKEWESERDVPGYVDMQLLLADDGRTVVQTVRFADKASYDALADDAEQAAWWESKAAQLLDGEPTWTDGTWLDR